MKKNILKKCLLLAGNVVVYILDYLKKGLRNILGQWWKEHLMYTLQVKICFTSLSHFKLQFLYRCISEAAQHLAVLLCFSSVRMAVVQSHFIQKGLHGTAKSVKTDSALW